MNLRILSTLLLACALTLPLALGLTGDSEPSPEVRPADVAPVEVTHHTLVSFDGTPIRYTVFRPGDATATDPTPLILHSHGWGGSRATSVGGTVRALTDAGYGVLSVDQRGHGESGGYATVLHKDYEVKDLIALVDWASEQLDWVETEGDPAEKDLVLGAVGGSYGGGYQLMLASYDDRLDAIVPQMTWNDLRYSLAPNGVVKSTWVDALYGFGLRSVEMHPDIHRWFAESLVTNSFPEDAYLHFGGSSPLPGEIQAKTLLIQGLPDALFNWNEAWHNYHGIRSAGTEVALVGYLGGHVLPSPGQPVGLMGPARGGEPCGEYGDLAVAWFQHHLEQLPVVVPSGITFALEDGGCVGVDQPEDLVFERSTFDVLPAPNTAGTILVPLDAPTGELAGVPRLAATFLGGTETIVSVGLAMRSADGRVHFIDDQTAFLRIGPAVGEVAVPIDLEMTGVATSVGAGDSLFLRIDGLHEWAPTGGGRTPGGGLFTDVTLELPYLP